MSEQPCTPTLERDFTVARPDGFHLRPAAMLVKTAMKYDSAITLSRGTESADARSLLEIMTLEAMRGAQITVTVSGEDAETAMRDISELLIRELEQNGVTR